MISKIGLGGSCHWCTEAIFLSLNGVIRVEQGWITSLPPDSDFSEGVLVHFDESIISLQTLIAVHLHTHSCTSTHRMRSKYRSAVYTFSPIQTEYAKNAVDNLQHNFKDKIITQVIPFITFRLNQESYLNYYYSNPQKPFCENVVNDKLRLLLRDFSAQVNSEKLKDL
ncbi:peptide-methionine (S)-S-oxide reductase [Dyadobacter psychrotolerans]|nr:peptide-methionine (S)-S-oxide reductase [Dyadobacter psychrotolerans]